MSDRIADILEDHFGQNHLSEEIDSVSKQIRQQIGREILTKAISAQALGINNSQTIYLVYESDIREVCQLEES